MQRLDAAFDFLNNKPINGELYCAEAARRMYSLPYWIPAQIAEKYYSENPRPRKPDIREMAAVLPVSREVAIRHGMVRVKCADWGGVYYFHHPDFAKLGDGWPVRVSFDPSDIERGAGIISMRETSDSRNFCGLRKGAFVGIAQNVERVPQVVVGVGDTLGFERAKRHAKLAHLLFREIVPVHRKRGATVHDYFNGDDSSRVQIDGYTPEEDAPQTPRKPSADVRRVSRGVPAAPVSDRRKINVEALFE